MKNLKVLSLIFLSVFVFTACSDDDTPDPVNEEEVITTVTVTLTPNVGGLSTVTLKSQDLDGDGPNAPVITVDDLAPGITYSGTVQFLNETESPAEDITLEIEAEDDEHQVFFTAGSGLNITTSYDNFDGNGNPLGTEFTLITGTVSSGTLTVTLRHEPTKPNTGLTDAGGETDATVTFPITIQ